MELPRFIALFIRSCHFSWSWARWVQSIPSYPNSFKIQFNIIIPFMHKSAKLYLSLRSAYQNGVCISLLRPSYHPWFGDQSSMWWQVQIVKPLIVQCSSICCVTYAVETVLWSNQWLKLYGGCLVLPPFISTYELSNFNSWLPVWLCWGSILFLHYVIVDLMVYVKMIMALCT